MDLAKINKIIAKQRKLAQSNPESGYSAILSGILENEAKGTFKSYPEYSRKLVNNFFAECVQGFRQTELFRESCKNQADYLACANDTVVLLAVLQQSIICGDLTVEEARLYNDDNASLVKVLVNIKLLPERCLNDCEFDMRVA